MNRNPRKQHLHYGGNSIHQLQLTILIGKHHIRKKKSNRLRIIKTDWLIGPKDMPSVECNVQNCNTDIWLKDFQLFKRSHYTKTPEAS